MRVTNQWVMNNFLRQAQGKMSSLSDMQVKISSGKNYLRASESPVDNAITMQHKTEIFENNQFMRNINHTKEWYDNVDTAMTTMESAIQRVRHLAVQGANDTLVQSDRDAIALEIDELMYHIVDVGNTQVAGQYVFGGHDVDKRPFEIVTGQTPGYNSSVVTHPMGETRDKINLARPIGIAYQGDDKRIVTEIERGTLVDKSITGFELFMGSGSTGTPGFAYTLPPLEQSLPLKVLNNGRGVQSGNIIVTDHNGVDHSIDLKSAHRLDDVIGMINDTGSFEAGIEEVPSDTAVSLGIYRNAGNANTLFGLSDPKMLSAFTNLTDLNDGLGVPDGYININARDGRNFRVDISGATTVGDVVNQLNATGGGAVMDVRFDMVHKRLEIKDITGGNGELSITSTRAQMYIKDLAPHVAQDLGILRNVGASNHIYSNYDSDLESELTPFELINGGKGIEAGYIDITGKDGVTSTVDLTSVHNMQGVIDAINAQTGGSQIASFDVTGKRLLITDNTVGVDDFRVEEVFGNNPVSVRDTTTVAKNLGLLRSESGNAVVGDPLSPPGLTTASLLSTLAPPPERGFLVIRGSDKEPVEVDLTDANTIDDVLIAINATDKFKATWDTAANRFVISDPLATGGNYGITVEEQSNTGRDLGFVVGSSNYDTSVITGAAINLQSLPTSTGAFDLTPALTEFTELESLNAGRTFNSGVNLGYIRITDKAGRFKAIDLRGSKTIGDVLAKINDTANGLYVEAKINADKNGIEIIDKNQGATGKLEIMDIDSTSAFDLGISGRTVDNNFVGKNVDPALSYATPVAALRPDLDAVPMGKVYVQSGDYSAEIDLSGCKTVGEIVDRLSNTDNNLNLQAWISEDGKRINLTNTKGQPHIKVRDVEGEPPTASLLGLGNSPSLFTTLIDLRDNLLRDDAEAISTKSIKNIDTELERVLGLHAEVGVKTNRVTASKEKQQRLTLNLREMLSSVEDIDMVEAIIRMNDLEIAYQAALQTGARVMQVTLLDFLR